MNRLPCLAVPCFYCNILAICCQPVDIRPPEEYNRIRKGTADKRFVPLSFSYRNNRDFGRVGRLFLFVAKSDYFFQQKENDDHEGQQCIIHGNTPFRGTARGTPCEMNRLPCLAVPCFYCNILAICCQPVDIRPPGEYNNIRRAQPTNGSSPRF